MAAGVLAVLRRHLALAMEVASDAQINEAREVLEAVTNLAEAAREVDKGMCGMSVKETRLLVRLHKALARMGEGA